MTALGVGALVRWVWAGLSFVLSGCAVIDPPPAQSFSDKDCAGIAYQRAADAAVNGYDASLQVRIRRDTYATCQSQARTSSLKVD